METTFSDVLRVYKVNSLDSANYTKEARERGLTAGFAIGQVPEKLLRGAAVHRVYRFSPDQDRQLANGRFAVEHAFSPIMVDSEGHRIFLGSAELGTPTFLISHDGKWDAEIVGYEGQPGQQLLVKLSGRLLGN